jgi:hypothetical protein
VQSSSDLICLNHYFTRGLVLDMATTLNILSCIKILISENNHEKLIWKSPAQEGFWWKKCTQSKEESRKSWYIKCRSQAPTNLVPRAFARFLCFPYQSLWTEQRPWVRGWAPTRLNVGELCTSFTQYNSSCKQVYATVLAKSCES